MKKIKKLAVLVGGEFREFENAHKSWTFLNDLEFDLFFSTWDMTYEKNEKLNINISESVTEDRITKYFPNVIINIEKDIDDLLYSHKIVYHWNKLFKMLNDSEYEYDTIILTRPDINILIKGDFSNFINNILSDRIYGMSQVYQLPEPDIIYVNDVFFMGKVSIMKKLMNLPKNANTNKSIHYHLGKFFVYNDIYVDGSFYDIIDFFIMRSIHRNFLNDDFQLQKKLCLKWWDAKHLEENKNI